MNDAIQKHRPAWQHWIVVCILSLLSAFAINIQPTIVERTNLFGMFRNVMGEVEPTHVIAVAALAWLYHQVLLRERRPFSLTALLVGGIFSVFLVVGMSFSSYADFSFITASKRQFALALTVFLGYWAILYAAIKLLLEKLDGLALKDRPYTGLWRKIDRHIFAFSVLVILACWVIFWAVYFPGSVPYDGRYQLNMYLGFQTMSRHHPYYSTLLMGVIYSIGASIGGSNAGIALYVAFQSVVCALIYGASCSYLRKKRMPLPAVLGFVLFFAVVPIWCTYAQPIMKDTIYTGFFAWFTLECVKCFLGDGGKYGSLRLGIAAILVCLFRSEGVYIVVLALLVLLFLVKLRRKGILITLAAALAVSIGLNGVLLDQMEIQTDSRIESLSLLLQQVAHYSIEYEDELTEDEKAVIDAIVPYEWLADYNPEMSDNVKKSSPANATDKEWGAVLKLWAKLFLRHPLTYIEAAVNEMYGYFDPFYFYSGLSSFQLYTKSFLNSNDTGPEYYSVYVTSDSLRNSAYQYVYLWQKIPILSFLVNPAAYVWTGILLLAVVLRRKDWRTALLYLPPIFIVLICCISPVNGLLRYMMPVCACMPQYVLLALHPKLPGNVPAQPEQPVREPLK
ncbi:MAG: DUF6020 family protein [Clostridiales bacterium]|nr:DUF6020 family protein [Clostridiales bacterium]